MSQPIQVDPALLRRAADGHNEAAEYLRSVPKSNEDLQATLDSLGPVYASLREQGRITLEQRRLSYEGQAKAHEGLSAHLDTANAMWGSHEEHTAAEFRGLTAT